MVYNIENGSLPGDPSRIIATGMSGGGALVAVLGATGNHPDFFESLYEAGALGLERTGGNFVDTGSDSIFAPFSFAPMIYALGGDYAYEQDYYPTRAAV